MEKIGAITPGLVKEQERKRLRDKRQQSQQLLQHLSQVGQAEAAEILDEHCTYCRALRRPVFDEVKTSLAPSGAYWYVRYPECGCPGERHHAEQQDAAKERAERDFQAAVFQASLQSCGLVGWLRSASFATFEGRQNWPGAMDAMRRVRQYTEEVITGSLDFSRVWLILHGRYGTGKTHLAAAAIRQATIGGVRGAYFRSWTEYLRRLQASWDREPGEERTSDVVAELQRGRLVAIDDLDKKEPRGGWAIEELYTVLNHRYNESLPTILTFNCAPDEIDPDAKGRLLLERYMGRAILDRVIGAKYDVVNFDGPSYRSGVKW